MAAQANLPLTLKVRVKYASTEKVCCELIDPAEAPGLQTKGFWYPDSGLFDGQPVEKNSACYYVAEGDEMEAQFIISHNSSMQMDVDGQRLPWKVSDFSHLQKIPRQGPMLAVTMNLPEEHPDFGKMAYCVSPNLDNANEQFRRSDLALLLPGKVAVSDNLGSMSSLEKMPMGLIVRIEVALTGDDTPIVSYVEFLPKKEIERILHPEEETVDIQDVVDEFIDLWSVIIKYEEFRDEVNKEAHRAVDVDVWFPGGMCFPVQAIFELPMRTIVGGKNVIQMLRLKAGDEVNIIRPERKGGFYGFVDECDCSAQPYTVKVNFDDRRSESLIVNREPEKAQKWKYSIQKGQNNSPHKMLLDFLQNDLKGFILNKSPAVAGVFQALIGYTKDGRGVADLPQGDNTCFITSAPDLPVMNTEQHRQIAKAVLEEERPLTLVLGPPGCGKSNQIAVLIHNILEYANRWEELYGRKIRILVVTQSNKAADHMGKLLMKLWRAGKSSVKPVRIYPEERVWRKKSQCADIAPVFLTHRDHTEFDTDEIRELRKKLRKLREELEKMNFEGKHTAERLQKMQELFKQIAELEKQIKEKIQSAMDPNVVIATSFMAACLKKNENWTFTHVFVDEAAQATMLSVAQALQVLDPTIGCKLYMAGDRYQLPPTIQCRGEAAAILSKTALSYLEDRRRCVVHRLVATFRMHPSILEFPRFAIYGGQLISYVSVQERSSLVYKFPFPRKEQPLMLMASFGQEIRAAGKSYMNADEAALAARLVKYLVCQAGVPLEDIGVLTFYEAQRVQLLQRIHRELNPVSRAQRRAEEWGEAPRRVIRHHIDEDQIANVDSFQGEEKRVIILSCVRSQAEHNNNKINVDPEKLGFLTDERRGNVAVTRPKEALFILGNPYTLAGHWFWRMLVDYYGRRGLIRPAYEQVMDNTKIRDFGPGNYDDQNHLIGATQPLLTDGLYDQVIEEDIKTEERFYDCSDA